MFVPHVGEESLAADYGTPLLSHTTQTRRNPPVWISRNGGRTPCLERLTVAGFRDAFNASRLEGEVAASVGAPFKKKDVLYQCEWFTQHYHEMLQPDDMLPIVAEACKHQATPIPQENCIALVPSAVEENKAAVICANDSHTHRVRARLATHTKHGVKFLGSLSSTDQRSGRPIQDIRCTSLDSDNELLLVRRPVDCQIYTLDRRKITTAYFNRYKHARFGHAITPFLKPRSNIGTNERIVSALVPSQRPGKVVMAMGLSNTILQFDLYHDAPVLEASMKCQHQKQPQQQQHHHHNQNKEPTSSSSSPTAMRPNQDGLVAMWGTLLDSPNAFEHVYWRQRDVLLVDVRCGASNKLFAYEDWACYGDSKLGHGRGRGGKGVHSARGRRARRDGYSYHGFTGAVRLSATDSSWLYVCTTERSMHVVDIRNCKAPVATRHHHCAEMVSMLSVHSLSPQQQQQQHQHFYSEESVGENGCLDHVVLYSTVGRCPTTYAQIIRVGAFVNGGVPLFADKQPGVVTEERVVVGKTRNRTRARSRRFIKHEHDDEEDEYYDSDYDDDDDNDDDADDNDDDDDQYGDSNASMSRRSNNSSIVSAKASKVVVVTKRRDVSSLVSVQSVDIVGNPYCTSSHADDPNSLHYAPQLFAQCSLLGHCLWVQPPTPPSDDKDSSNTNLEDSTLEKGGPKKSPPKHGQHALKELAYLQLTSSGFLFTDSFDVVPRLSSAVPQHPTNKVGGQGGDFAGKPNDALHDEGATNLSRVLLDAAHKDNMAAPHPIIKIEETMDGDGGDTMRPHSTTTARVAAEGVDEMVMLNGSMQVTTPYPRPHHVSWAVDDSHSGTMTVKGEEAGVVHDRGDDMKGDVHAHQQHDEHDAEVMPSNHDNHQTRTPTERHKSTWHKWLALIGNMHAYILLQASNSANPLSSAISSKDIVRNTHIPLVAKRSTQTSYKDLSWLANHSIQVGSSSPLQAWVKTFQEYGGGGIVINITRHPKFQALAPLLSCSKGDVCTLKQAWERRSKEGLYESQEGELEAIVPHGLYNQHVSAHGIIVFVRVGSGFPIEIPEQGLADIDAQRARSSRRVNSVQDNADDDANDDEVEDIDKTQGCGEGATQPLFGDAHFRNDHDDDDDDGGDDDGFGEFGVSLSQFHSQPQPTPTMSSNTSMMGDLLSRTVVKEREDRVGVRDTTYDTFKIEELDTLWDKQVAYFHDDTHFPGLEIHHTTDEGNQGAEMNTILNSTALNNNNNINNNNNNNINLNTTHPSNLTTALDNGGTMGQPSLSTTINNSHNNPSSFYADVNTSSSFLGHSWLQSNRGTGQHPEPYANPFALSQPSIPDGVRNTTTPLHPSWHKLKKPAQQKHTAPVSLKRNKSLSQAAMPSPLSQGHTYGASSSQKHNK